MIFWDFFFKFSYFTALFAVIKWKGFTSRNAFPLQPRELWLSPVTKKQQYSGP